mgnify:CR=1 FL=1
MLILPEILIAVAGEAPQPGWGVRVVGDVITAVGPHADLRRDFPEDEVWEAPEQVLAPGFVNAHAHLYGVLAHGLLIGLVQLGVLVANDLAHLL